MANWYCAGAAAVLSEQDSAAEKFPVAQDSIAEADKVVPQEIVAEQAVGHLILMQFAIP